MKTDLIAAIEAGGTKFNCAIGTGPDDIRLSTRIETTDPQDTLREVVSFFESANRQLGKFSAIGIGSFGPLDLYELSDTYGYITTTPKPGWKYTDLLSPLKELFHVPIAIDTDVNAAAMGEFTWGNGRGCDPLIYLTIGTGIGGGVYINGKLVHGALHPEIGHLFIPQVISDAPNAEGVCEYHGACLEGLISGTALRLRWGAAAESFAEEHPIWAEFSTLLAIALANLTFTLAPRRIIIGGGVMKQSHLLPMVREELQRFCNGYLQSPELMENIESYVVAPGLGDRSGILGAMALAQQVLQQRSY